MKINRIAFNLVGVVIAGLCGLAAVSTLLIVLPQAPANSHRWGYFIATWEAVAAITLCVGGVVNLVEGRLAPWPTGIMIAGYLATVMLLPLALWGVVSLILERKHQQRELEKIRSVQGTGAGDGSRFVADNRS